MADDDLQALEGFANLGVNELLVDLPDYRCPRCYFPQRVPEGLRNHVQNCLQGDQLTIQGFWETAEAWEADWTGRIPLQVLLDLGESNNLLLSRYCLISDPQHVPRNFVLSLDVVNVGFDYPARLERASISTARGLSVYLSNFADGEKRAVFNHMAICLQREQALLAMLQQQNPRLDRFSIRCAKGLIDAHDLDQGFCILIAPLVFLDNFVENREAGERLNAPDAFQRVGRVALGDFLREDFDALTFCRSLFQVNDGVFNFQLRCYLESAHLSQLRHVLSSVDQEVAGVLLGFNEFNEGEKIVRKFGVGGGKRNLGETPLECAIRETSEEFDIDLGNYDIVGGEDSTWTVMRRRRRTRRRKSWMRKHKKRSKFSCLTTFQWLLGGHTPK